MPATELPNRNTCFLQLGRLVSDELTERALACAEQLQEHFAAPLPDNVPVIVRIALIGASDLDLYELSVDPDSFVVVGRHSEASVRADSSSSLSLRHVLLIPHATAEDHITLEIVSLSPTIDPEPWLHTHRMPEPLATRCTGLVLGDALLLVATVGRGAETAVVKLAPTLEKVSSAHRHARDDRARRLDYDDDEPRKSEIVTIHPTSITALADLSVADAPDAKLRLQVTFGDQRVTVALREAWLEAGLLLGREDRKCSHPALGAALSSNDVSRCHVYLRREGDAIVFYDTASTWGLHMKDELVRRIAIPAPVSCLDSEDAQAKVNPERLTLDLTDRVSVTLQV